MNRFSELPVPDKLTLFVPTIVVGSAVSRGVSMMIRPGSAMVGSQAGSGDDTRWLVDYEGNANGAVNLETFEERLQSAAGRHVQKYPTIARIAAAPDNVVAIGEVRHSKALGGFIITELSQPKLLALWIAPEELPRVGGSQALWDRAAGRVVEKQGYNVMNIQAIRHLNMRNAAYHLLAESEPGLTAPAVD